jgi:glycosyltransferase involved in cell wall biosynthesis
MKLVSVIIPCYNQANFLGEAIESALSQTYRHFEVIVVDDGSPDNTTEVASGYPGVRCIRQENQGQGAARNTGLHESKGSYLIFLDADDRLLPNALQIGLNCLDAHPECAFVYGHIKIINSDGSPQPTQEQYCIEKGHFQTFLRYNFIWTPATVMFRRDVFESIMGFEPSLSPAEDWDLYLRITRSFPIYCHDNVVAEYRVHRQNITRNYALMLKTSLAVLRSQWKYIKGRKDYEEAYETGLKTVQDYFGEPLVDEFLGHVRGFELKQAMHKILALLRYYPQGLAKLFVRKAQRSNFEGGID